MIKNPYNLPSQPPSIYADVIPYNRGYNPQEISVLRFAFEYMPFLLVEDALLDARRACSRTQKSLFLQHTQTFLEKRREQPAKYLDISYLHGQYSISQRGPFFLSRRTFLSLTEKHRRTEYTKAHRDIKSTDFTEPYSQRQLIINT